MAISSDGMCVIPLMSGNTMNCFPSIHLVVIDTYGKQYQPANQTGLSEIKKNVLCNMSKNTTIIHILLCFLVWSNKKLVGTLW